MTSESEIALVGFDHGPRGVQRLTWEEVGEGPNLAEYDVVIISLRPLSETLAGLHDAEGRWTDLAERDRLTALADGTRVRLIKLMRGGGDVVVVGGTEDLFGLQVEPFLYYITDDRGSKTKVLNADYAFYVDFLDKWDGTLDTLDEAEATEGIYDLFQEDVDLDQETLVSTTYGDPLIFALRFTLKKRKSGRFIRFPAPSDQWRSVALDSIVRMFLNKAQPSSAGTEAKGPSLEREVSAEAPKEARARTGGARGKPPDIPDPRSVMVVHGRDLANRDALFDLLSALDLKPVEWSQAVRFTKKGAPYIGEVLASAFAKAQAVVVLLTGDDEARLKSSLGSPAPTDQDLELQPRPNVLLELGMALATHAERTVLLQVGELRRITDIDGLHVVRVAEGPEWRHHLAARLAEAGCAVDQSGSRWLGAGKFSWNPA